MQGKKEYQEKLFSHFQMSDRISKENFYRRLKSALNLDYLYVLTRDYYRESGQKSICPTVFFKLCLVGYLENIISDRHLISHCSLRLDILDCPLRSTCLQKSQEKRLTITYYVDQYERNNARVASPRGRL